MRCSAMGGRLAAGLVQGVLILGVMLAQQGCAPKQRPGAARVQADAARMAAELQTTAQAGKLWPWPEQNGPPLLKGDEDWGAPPESKGIVKPLEQLPPFKGWYHYLNTGTYNGDLYAVADGLALVQMDNELIAYDARSGKERWRTAAPHESRMASLSGDSLAYLATGNDLCALVLSNGRERWRAAGKYPFYLGPRGLWCGVFKSDENTNCTLTKLEFISAASGKATAQFDLPPGVDQPITEAITTDHLALRLDKTVRVFLSSGKTVDIPLHRPDWQAAFGYAPGLQLVIESATLDIGKYGELTFDEFAQLERKLSLDPQTGRQGPGAVVYCYGLPDGKLRWRSELSVKQLEECCPGATYFPCLEGYAIFSGYGGMFALRLADGTATLQQAPPPSDVSSVAQYLPLGPPADGLVYVQRYAERGSKLECVPAPGAPATPEQSVLLPAGVLNGFGITAGRLVAMYELGEAREGIGTSRGLLSLPLGRSGLPQPGALKVLDGPQLPDALRQRFLASPDPRCDTALMRDVVASGPSGILHIAREVKLEQAAQLDALAALAEYCYANGGTDCLNLMELLCDTLEPRARPALTPHVLRWIRDASLHTPRSQLLLLLARCGGPEAKPVLDALYAPGQVARHTPPAPPYAVSAEGNAEEQPSDFARQAGTWVEVKHGRAAYALFPASGLLGDRDLYLAISRKGDGAWNELLPTGLMDFCYYSMLPGGFAGPGPKGPLALTLSGGKLRITHHKPVFETFTDGEGVDQQTYMRFADAERVTDSLTLKALRADSDGDGLTDVLEGMLLTDPARADSDGDGLADSLDPTPLSDPARMGPLERGIARALKLCLERERLDRPDSDGSWRQRGLLPYHASYLVLHGCHPVAYCTDAGEYSISLSTLEQRQAFKKALGGYPAYGEITITYWRPGLTPAEEREASGEADTVESGGAGFPGITEPGATPRPSTVALEVYFDFSSSGMQAQLALVDGEYYPITCEGTWMT